ncbi:MAG: hypothetical protein CSA18_04585 [Deltaproteobacteria bacterium]|nr:MAG: hypothetical protein CSA18_04585 [Deltaproteobacteria bacterium]
MKRFVYLILLIFFSASSVFAIDFYHFFHGEYHSEGDIIKERQNINSANRLNSDITSEEVTFTTTDQKEELPDKTQISTGFESTIVKNVKDFTLPLSYGMPVNFLKGQQEFINFKLKIPYTKREIGDIEDSGLGDIKLSVNYLTKSSKYLLNTIFLIKFATGEFEDADVPLGTGSTDFAISVNGKWYLEKLTLFGGLGYVYTGDFSSNGSTVEYGDEFLISGGADYKINDRIKVEAGLIYNSHGEEEFSGTMLQGKSAGIKTFDFIPGISYLIKKYNVSINAKLIIPVSESWENQKNPYAEDPDRDVAFKIKFAKPF